MDRCRRRVVSGLRRECWPRLRRSRSTKRVDRGDQKAPPTESKQRSIIDGAINEAPSTYRTSSLIHPECEECMLKHLRMFTMVALAATVISAAGCSKGSATDNQSPNTASKSPDKVTYVTAFGAVGRDAFAWVALKKGYFTEANLDVTIQLGAAVDQNLSELAAGQAQFAA